MDDDCLFSILPMFVLSLTLLLSRNLSNLILDRTSSQVNIILQNKIRLWHGVVVRTPGCHSRGPMIRFVMLIFNKLNELITFANNFLPEEIVKIYFYSTRQQNGRELSITTVHILGPARKKYQTRKGPAQQHPSFRYIY